MSPRSTAARSSSSAKSTIKARNAFLAGAAALLFPIDWPEPFGLVMIEAMACGTPVIAYRHGSVPEVIDEGVTGFVVDDEEQAVRAFGRLDEIDRRQVRASFSAASPPGGWPTNTSPSMKSWCAAMPTISGNDGDVEDVRGRATARSIGIVKCLRSPGTIATEAVRGSLEVFPSRTLRRAEFDPSKPGAEESAGCRRTTLE